MSSFTTHPYSSRLIKIALCCFGLAAGASIQAQVLQDNQWHGGISVGGSYASSNTSSQTFTVNANGSKATKEDKLGGTSVLLSSRGYDIDV